MPVIIIAIFLLLLLFRYLGAKLNSRKNDDEK